ncbi:MAG: hypothetical protein QOJ07_802 [Thermoleophilaceae bacterium]|jgi:uncharacterized membrane protein|nr:hypothetical protein [Thermoleophilaceae bacterium]
MPLAIATYDAVKAVHVMAVIAAYGLPLAYPMLLPYVRRRHPRAMPGLHDVQHRLNIRLTGPGTVLVLVLGSYMASKQHLWGETWVTIPLAILAAIAVFGAYIVKATGELSELARVDVEAAPAGGAVAFGADYQRTYRRYMAVEIFLGVLVLVAVFVMVTKPFG